MESFYEIIMTASVIYCRLGVIPIRALEWVSPLSGQSAMELVKDMCLTSNYMSKFWGLLLLILLSPRPISWSHLLHLLSNHRHSIRLPRLTNQSVTTYFFWIILQVLELHPSGRWMPTSENPPETTIYVEQVESWPFHKNTLLCILTQFELLDKPTWMYAGKELTVSFHCLTLFLCFGSFAVLF